MTTLIPRRSYTDEELQKLYPSGLELQLVQILMRHGERTPVSARFQNAGLSPFWPYCAVVKRMKSVILEGTGRLTDEAGPRASFTTFEWKRRVETFGPEDKPVLITGPNGELDNVCDMGMLTDLGRQSTYKLGLRLRELYVDRLKFIPPSITSTDFLYLRATPIPRALESLQQTFTALYPLSKRKPGEDGTFSPPTIITRAPRDETLFPNEGNCRRLAMLSRAFAQRAADKWNRTQEMDYLQKLYGKWMPADSPQVAVDSRPRLSGIMDTINSTLAHGPEIRLPEEFYDPKGKRLMERICNDEWFSGYNESREFRILGIGSLLGDVVSRMDGSVKNSTANGTYELVEGSGQDKTAHIKFGISSCHDTTLAGTLASLGAFNMKEWPPYTSHIAIEMFRRSDMADDSKLKGRPVAVPKKLSWLSSIMSLISSSTAETPPPRIGRRSTEELTSAEAAKLDGYYVRLRYNDEPVTIPGCGAPGKHLENDQSFCTLAAFKAIVNKFTPHDWRKQCRSNLDKPVFAEGPETSGY